MKTLQSLAYTIVLIVTLLLPTNAFAQRSEYPDMYGMQRVHKLYNTIYMPKLNTFKTKVDNRIKSGSNDFSDLREEFNENFRELTYPMSAAEGANGTALQRLIRFAKGEDALVVLCEWERDRCVKRMEEFTSVSSSTFPDLNGVIRVNKIFDTYYAPRIKSLQQQAAQIHTNKKTDFSKIALAINTEFGEWIGVSASADASYNSISNMLEIAEAAIRRSLLVGEKERNQK